MSKAKTCQACGEDFYPDKEWKKICLSCYKKIKGRENAEIERLRTENERLRDQAVIPKSIQRLLIQLCHPDKHEGSNASKKAVQWLLNYKDRGNS